VSLYASTGCFINGLTRFKDFFQTTLYHKRLKEYLEEDKANNVDVAIIEITAESVLRNDLVHMLPFDVVALSSFYKGLYNHFGSEGKYLACKREILEKQKCVLLRKEDKNYALFADMPHKTFGYDSICDYQLEVLSNSKDGLLLKYGNETFKTNLITAYHARNMACSIAILDYLNLLDIATFKEFSKSIFIRGRMEKVKDNIIIDTGLVGMDMLLLGLEVSLGNNYKVVYSTVPYTDENEWVKESRRHNGEYLKRAKYIYLTSPENNPREEEIFINDVMGGNYLNYSFISDPKECLKKAIQELKRDETLIIVARNDYRMYRHLVEELS